jgi:hypothetical protein
VVGQCYRHGYPMGFDNLTLNGGYGIFDQRPI